MNSCHFIGRITKDFDLKFLPGSGQAMCTFTLAIDRNMSRAKQTEAKAVGKPVADFPQFTAWAKDAENAVNFLGKGRLVAVEASFNTSTSKNAQGETKYNSGFTAHKIEYLDKAGETGSQGGHADNSRVGSAFTESDDNEDIPF